jgi:histone-lysine N-methyltransferase SETMAR
MSEPVVGQLWPSAFGHSKWEHAVCFVVADEEDVSVKIRQRCVIECCVKLGKSGNETLEMLRQAYGGDPLSKQQSSVWKHSNSPPPKKFCSSLSTGKVMLLLFFDAHGMILQHWVPRGQTVNGAYYANVLRTDLRGAMRKKRPDLLKNQWFLLQDNARPHIAAVALAALNEIGGTALQHPPYSSDLAPCEFWAFQALKRQLRGKRFSSDDEVKNATAAVLKGMSQNSLFHVFELLLKSCKKFVQCEGRYFEKEKNCWACRFI